MSWATGFGIGWVGTADTTYSIHTVGVGYLMGEIIRTVALAFGATRPPASLMSRIRLSAASASCSAWHCSSDIDCAPGNS